MFTTLRLQNFKGWKDTERIELAPITLFFGSNSSGKTSLLQSLLLLKQTIDSADRTLVLNTSDARSTVDLGSALDVIHNHDASSKIGYSFRWTPQPEDFPTGAIPSRRKKPVLRFRLNVGLERRAANPYVSDMFYQLDDRKIGMKLRETGTHPEMYDLIDEDFGLVRKKGRAWPLPDPTRFFGFPDELIAYYQNAEKVSDLPLALERQFARTHYVGPIRESPSRQYLWTGQRPESVGPRGESSIAALLAADQAGQKVSSRQQGRGRRDSSILQVVAEWLRELGIIHSFEVRPLAKGKRYYEVRVRRTPASPEVLLPDVGFGVSQVLPILVQSFYAAPHSTMLYEQPELHLHPSAQSELADAIIDASIRGNVQFLIESHSEHFLRRIQRRVAEGLPQEHVALYKCEVIDGVSTLQRLNVDAKGNVTNWPRDFFGDTIGDLMAMTKAAAAPRRRE